MTYQENNRKSKLSTSTNIKWIKSAHKTNSGTLLKVFKYAINNLYKRKANGIVKAQ